ncbi:urea ABC transporter permease subunit UrtB [Opitutales bacterium]|nr:urea ABC transporter permease subunit UrtB [Opitutales bacterium]
MNQFFSVSSFFLFILVFFTGPDGHLCGSENANGLNKDKILEDMKKLASEDKKIVTQAVKDLAKSGDIRLELFFEMYRQGSIYNWPSKSGDVRIVLNEETLMDDDFNEFAPLLHPLSKEPFLINGEQAKPGLFELEDISPGRKLRSLVNSSKFLLRLFSPDLETRLSGVKKCGDPPFLPDALSNLEEISNNKNEDAKVRHTAKESMELMILGGVVEGKKSIKDRVLALEKLGNLKSLRALARIDPLESAITALSTFKDYSKTEIKNFKKSISSVRTKIEGHKEKVEWSGNLFRGFSYGSVLILIALGLAITFGLMGVINMAHGELMMIGAYTTYEVQLMFGHSPDNPVNHYYLFALPLAFCTAAVVGLIIEALVVRHLYNRPLESLLATWGVGLFLIQVIRIIYGDNIGVNSPIWARGGYEIYQDIVLPYARLYLLGLSISCVCFVYFIIRKTRFGMLIRATMQNRDMANSLGVRTRKIDRLTFALGSGIAGVAGYGWTIIGGVTPDMGQTNFIVDSFLVVVTGGVGELIGVVYSGLGIGILTKLIEPLEIGTFTIGPVWGKVILLALIVAFIQYRPSGLFAPKGRLADKK